VNTFFPLSVLNQVKAPELIAPRCGLCKLDKQCQNGKMPVSGKGKKRIMIIGEAPGEHEDRKNKQFVGKSGQYLRDRLKRCGIDPDKDVWFHNALSCRPPNNKITNSEWVEYCRPNVTNAIKEYEPETVILLGYYSVKSVIGHLWKEDVGKISRWTGWQIPAQRFNCWICPTFHPSFLMRQESQVLDNMFLKQINSAVKLKGRPWKKVPDYKSKVRIVFDEKEAKEMLLRFAKGSRPVAIDYETNMLKPDADNAMVVGCSASDGVETIAYPWTKVTRKYTGKLIRSGVPIVASNIKFEERWTQKVFGHGIKNWEESFDTMLASHVLDNRPGINSIKFQSFVMLGQESYDDHIKPYLRGDTGGGYEVNRIREIDMRDLLLYCGLDSLLEIKVSQIQKGRLEET
jgi:uracil-DNA glycosylase family 4